MPFSNSLLIWNTFYHISQKNIVFVHLLVVTFSPQLQGSDAFGSIWVQTFKIYFQDSLFLKLVSAIFYEIFYFHQMIVLKNYKKCFLFHLKSSFHARDIQICGFSSSSLFLPVSHCFTCWSKNNLKVYDVINGLNKNSVTHFFYILGKK